MYQMTNEVGFTRCGVNGLLKLHEAVALMMDCCQFQEYQEVEFCRILRERNLAVFLSSIQIDIHRMPSFREKITTTVKIYGCKSIYGLRRITIKDAENNICMIANATGAFFDISAQKAVKIDSGNFPLEFDEAEPMECLPRKIQLPPDAGVPYPATMVNQSELDCNGHLTSSEYFAISGNILPANFTYNRVRLEYKQQALCGNLILPVVHYNGTDKVIVNMQSGNGNSFAVAEYTTTGDI